MTHLLQKLLDEKGILLADGATGTNLFGMGLKTGDAPELWNIKHPDRIAHHYKSFINAGSDIILTNTFGGNCYRLKLHQSGDRVEDISRAGAEIARQQIENAGREVVLGGSIGPTGEMLEPLGTLKREQAIDAFAEQASALQSGGVDVLWIETMSSNEEVEVAVAGAKTTGLPIVVTMSVDTNGRTMMGITPADIATFAAELEPAPFAVGVNCGVGASEVVAAVLNMTNAPAGKDAIIIAKANCGIPEYKDGKIVYNGTPEIMSTYTCMSADAGARIIGGCCGTTPSHISAMREALDHYQPGSRPMLQDIEKKLGEISTGAKAQLRGELEVTHGAVGQRAGRRSRRNK